MVWLVLRCIDIHIHLEIAAELHQTDTIFHRPRNTIVAFDKSTVLTGCVIFDLKFAYGFFCHLVKNHFQRAQSVKCCIGVFTKDCDHIVLDSQNICISLVKQIICISNMVVEPFFNCSIGTFCTNQYVHSV